MKFLILLLAVIALVYLLRGTRRRVNPPPQPKGTERVQTMVSCQQCGLHLPGTDALPGRGGVFCSEAHRAEYERQHPKA